LHPESVWQAALDVSLGQPENVGTFIKRHMGLPEYGRPRLTRLDRTAYDAILLVSPPGSLDELERVRDFL
jgi:hypothetical protein